MKALHACDQDNGGTRRMREARAFTLAEMMVALTIFTVVMLGMVGVQMFGMRYDELVNSKLGASDKSRMGFDKLASDIRGAMVWKIGTGSTNNFTQCTTNTSQVGNSLQISYTSYTNPTSYDVRYWFDTNNAWLCRMVSGSTYPSIIASSLTNTTGSSMTFRAEDYQGNLATDWLFKYVVVTTMEFAQYQYPLTKVGPGNYYNYYRIQFKISSHNAAFP